MELSQYGVSASSVVVGGGGAVSQYHANGEISTAAAWESGQSHTRLNGLTGRNWLTRTYPEYTE